VWRNEIVKFKNSQHKDINFISVNKVAQKYLKNFKENIISFYSDIPENPELDNILPLISYVKEQYQNYESIYIAYTEFVKSGVFNPKIVKLLPIEKIRSSEDPREPREYSIEPDPITLLNSLSNLYIDLEIYESILSNQASEHSARMIAMKKATDNVKEIVNTLTLKLNKERQAKITQAMAEISSNI
jgi:F-type H+-transporting ATPase subunit gamma